MVLLFEMRHALFYIHTLRHLGETGREGGFVISRQREGYAYTQVICRRSLKSTESTERERRERRKDELGTSLRDVIGF
jgi:hypothetical protein